MTLFLDAFQPCVMPPSDTWERLHEFTELLTCK